MYSAQKTFTGTRERYILLGIYSCSPRLRQKKLDQKIPLFYNIFLSALPFRFLLQLFFKVGNFLEVLLRGQNLDNKTITCSQYTDSCLAIFAVIILAVWDFRRLSANLMGGIEFRTAVCNMHLYVVRYSPEIVLWYFYSRIPKEQDN